MDLPPTFDSRGASVPPVVESVEARELAELREGRRVICAGQAAEVRRVARLVKRCRADVRERVLALGDTELDMDGEVFAHRRCVDSVMVALGVGKGEAAGLVNLADRLTVLPAVFDAWAAGVLDGSRVRVLADATEVLDDATARAVAAEVLAWAGNGPWEGLAPRSWRSRVEEAVVRADADAAARRRAAAVAARRVRSWVEGDGPPCWPCTPARAISRWPTR